LQVCTVCATPAQLEQVVDLIMQLTLRDALKADPDVRLVTLTCGHIFTAETLDGHMDLHSYYTNVQGKWSGLLTPDGYQKRKTCPSCRASISSPRYNRVTKRALLDLQEQVAVMRFTTTLQVHSNDLNAINEERSTTHVKKLLNKVVSMRVTKFDGKRMVAELSTYTTKMIHCVSANAFSCEKNNMFGISGVLGDAWRKAMQRHLRLYANLVQLVNQNRMPHNVAYQGAISSIYFKELELARESSVSATRDPAKAALLMARRRVGAPPPGGQAVCTVEAIALTIDLRLKMFRVALNFIDFLWNCEGLGPYRPEARKQEREAINASRKGAAAFQRLATGLLLSCTRDAQVMIGLASQSDLPRLILQGHLLWLTVAAELTRYKSLWALRQMASGGGVIQRADRDAKAEMAKRSANERALCAQRFLKAFGVLSIEQKDNAPFLAEADKIRTLAEQTTDDWAKFETQLLVGEWYEEVSLEEKQAALRAVLGREWGELQLDPGADHRHDWPHLPVPAWPPIHHRRRE
jgi:hypothetical protein